MCICKSEIEKTEFIFEEYAEMDLIFFVFTGFDGDEAIKAICYMPICHEPTIPKA